MNVNDISVDAHDLSLINHNCQIEEMKNLDNGKRQIL